MSCIGMAPDAVATSVTNLELGAAVTVLSLAILLLSAITIRNVVKAVRTKGRTGAIRRYVTALVAALLLIPLIRFSDVEIHLLMNPEYVVGRTIGFCQVFARGAGIEFRYKVDGISYTNCNTFHPLSKDEIEVPGGFYQVRYSARFPGKGRIDFKKPSSQPTED